MTKPGGYFLVDTRYYNAEGRRLWPHLSEPLAHQRADFPTWLVTF